MAARHRPGDGRRGAVRVRAPPPRARRPRHLSARCFQPRSRLIHPCLRWLHRRHRRLPPIHNSSPSRVFRCDRGGEFAWTGDQAHRQPRPRAESDVEPSEGRALEANESTTAYVTHLVVSRQYRCATRVRVDPAAASHARRRPGHFSTQGNAFGSARDELYSLLSSMAWRGDRGGCRRSLGKLYGDESSPWRQRGAGKSTRGAPRLALALPEPVPRSSAVGTRIEPR
jgi:hypothetical protein